MILKNKKTGELWNVIYDDNHYGHDAYIWFYAEHIDDDHFHTTQYFTYASVEKLNEEWEDYLPQDYKDYVAQILQEYYYQIERESSIIYDACNGDFRRHKNPSYENSGRRQAIKDVAKALGIDLDAWSSDSDRDRLPPRNGRLYSYGFEWEQEFYSKSKKEKDNETISNGQ